MSLNTISNYAPKRVIFGQLNEIPKRFPEQLTASTKHCFQSEQGKACSFCSRNMHSSTVQEMKRCKYSFLPIYKDNGFQKCLC